MRFVTAPMGENRRVVEAYLGTVDRTKTGPLLAEDVEWVEWVDGVPSTGARVRGRSAFIENFGSDELRSEVVRITEQGPIVVAEGIAHVHKKDGQELAVRFCNIFEIEHGRVKRLDSFGALLKDPG